MNHSSEPITEILVPLDFSDCSLKALDFAKRMANVTGSRLHLLHVDDDPLLVPVDTDPAYRQEQEDKMAKKLDALVSPEEQAKYRVVMSIQCGTANHEIEEYARNNKIDMIVMGTHGRSAITEMLIGSVSQHVMKHACCPVTAVRE